MVIVSAMMLIFIVFYIIFFGQTLNLYHSHDSFIALRDSYELSAAINYVHLAGDGLSYDFTSSGGPRSLNMTLSDVAVESRRKHTLAQAPLINSRVNTTLVNSSRITLTNEAGAIMVGQQ